MIEIQVRIAEGMHEFARLKTAYLRHHQREQGIGGDIERHAEENVGTALVHLAGKASIGHVELKQDVTRGQLHLVDLGGVPGRHDVAARIPPGPYRIYHLRGLVTRAPLARRPAAAPPTTHPAQLSLS